MIILLIFFLSIIEVRMPAESYQIVDVNHLTLETLQLGLETTFYSLSFIFILTNQIGFSFLESGSVRAKNVQSIEFKNLVEISITVLAWWVLGYSLAYGSDVNGFIGTPGIIENRLHWLFTSSFACTQATILTGCVSERMTIPGYVLYNVF